MAKFKVLSKVRCFGFQGRRYLPGEIVECSEEDAAGFNFDFLERVPEPTIDVAPSVVAVAPDVSVSDVVEAVALLAPEVKVDEIIVSEKTLKKVKPKVLPKVS
jgi:hypothetical protein